MTGSSRHARRAMRLRRRRFFAAALCAASFVTGQLLFGGEPSNTGGAAPSALSEYRQAKSRVALAESALEREPATVAPTKPTADAPRLEPLPAAKPGGRGLRAATVQAVSEMPVAEADMPQRDNRLRPAIALEPVKTAAQPEAPPSEPSQPTTITDDSNLPPIVPAWAMPKPVRKPAASIAPANPAPSSTAAASPVAQTLTSPTTPQSMAAPLRVELGQTEAASPAQRMASLNEPKSPPGFASTSRFTTDRFASWPKPGEVSRLPTKHDADTAQAARPIAAAPAWLAGPIGQQPPTKDLSASKTQFKTQNHAELAPAATAENKSNQPPAWQVSPAPPLEIRNPNVRPSTSKLEAPPAP